MADFFSSVYVSGFPGKSFPPGLGVTVDPSLKFYVYVRRILTVGAGLTTSSLGFTFCRDSDFLMSLYATHVRHNLEYGYQLCNVVNIDNVKLLERTQKRWTSAMSDMAEMPYSERSRLLDLFSVRGRLPRADPTYVWRILNGLSPLTVDDLFVPHPTRATRGHNFVVFPS